MTTFCGSCGTKLNGEFCSICGTRMGGSADSPVAPTTASTSSAPAYPSSYQQAPGNDISPALIKRWNWGAFLLSYLWPFWHGLPWLGIAAIICAVTAKLVITAFIGLAIAIYLGLKGNQLAAKNRVYGSDAEFIAVESAWRKWGVGVLILPVVLGFIAFVIVMFLAESRPHY